MGKAADYGFENKTTYGCRITEIFQKENGNYIAEVLNLCDIKHLCKFTKEGVESSPYNNLGHLVKKKIWKPYDCVSMIPKVVVRHKGGGQFKIGDTLIFVGSAVCTAEHLFEFYTNLDGSPFGQEVKS